MLTRAPTALDQTENCVISKREQNSQLVLIRLGMMLHFCLFFERCYIMNICHFKNIWNKFFEIKNWTLCSRLLTTSSVTRDTLTNAWENNKPTNKDIFHSRVHLNCVRWIFYVSSINSISSKFNTSKQYILTESTIIETTYLFIQKSYSKYSRRSKC